MSPLKRYYYLELRRLIRAILTIPLDIFRFGLKFKKLILLKRKYSFNSTIIIGGGVKYKEVLSQIQENKNVGIMVMNRFALSSLADRLTPHLYLLIDPYFLNINNPGVSEILKYISKKKCSLIIPSGCKKDFLEYLESLQIDFYFINSRFSRILGFWSPFLPRSTVGMSLLMSLSINKFLSVKKIILCGFESNLFKFLNVNADNKLKISYPSFGNTTTTAINSNVSQYFLSLYFFHQDLERFKKVFNGEIKVVGESIIDSFDKI